MTDISPLYNWRTFGRNAWRITQNNEYTHVSKNGESLCFFCEEYKLTTPRIYPVCFDCFFNKVNREAVLKAKGVDTDGVCAACGDWCRITHVWNIIKLNVRVCKSCRHRIYHNRENIGPKPQYKRLHRMHGKNWREVTGSGNQTYSKIRRMRGETDGEFDIEQ